MPPTPAALDSPLTFAKVSEFQFGVLGSSCTVPSNTRPKTPNPKRQPLTPNYQTGSPPSPRLPPRNLHPQIINTEHRIPLWCFNARYPTHIVAPRTPNFHFELRDKLRVSSPATYWANRVLLLSPLFRRASLVLVPHTIMCIGVESFTEENTRPHAPWTFNSLYRT